jgi:hypothetical protein
LKFSWTLYFCLGLSLPLKCPCPGLQKKFEVFRNSSGNELVFTILCNLLCLLNNRTDSHGSIRFLQ